MDKKQFIMNNVNILNKKLNILRIEQLDHDVFESEFIFNKICKDTVLLIKDLTHSFYVGLDPEKGFVKVKNNKKTVIKDIKTIKTVIKNIDKKIIERIELIYSAFVDDESIPVTVSSYKEYFKKINENIENEEPRIIDINSLTVDAKLSASIGLKENGEEFGLGSYSSITFNSSISMEIAVESIKDFQDFAFNINNRALKFMKIKMRKQHLDSLKDKKVVLDDRDTTPVTEETAPVIEDSLPIVEIGIEELTSPKL